MSGTTTNCCKHPAAQHIMEQHSLHRVQLKTACQTLPRVGSTQTYTCSTAQHSMAQWIGVQQQTNCAADPSACWWHPVAHLQHNTAQRIIARHSGHRVRKQAARQNPQRVGGTKLHTCSNTHHSIAQHSTAKHSGAGYSAPNIAGYTVQDLSATPPHSLSCQRPSS